MARNVTYSRGLLYSDGIGIETGVSFDPTYRLGAGDQSYVEIEGVGEPVHVRVDHIPHLIEWLQDIAAADRAYRAMLSEREKSLSHSEGEEK